MRFFAVLCTVKALVYMCQTSVKTRNKCHRLLTRIRFLFPCDSGRLEGGGGRWGDPAPAERNANECRFSEPSSFVFLSSRSQRTPSPRLTAFSRLLARRHRTGDTRLPLARGRRSRQRGRGEGLLPGATPPGPAAPAGTTRLFPHPGGLPEHISPSPG